MKKFLTKYKHPFLLMALFIPFLFIYQNCDYSYTEFQADTLNGTLQTNGSSENFSMQPIIANTYANAFNTQTSNTGYLSCGQLPDTNFNINTPFTVSLWIKSEQMSNGHVLMGAGNGSNTGWFLRLAHNQYLDFFLAGQTGALHTRTPIPSLDPDLDVWYHIVFTYDGSNSASGIGIYVNDIEIDRNTHGVWSSDAIGETQFTGPLTLGALQGVAPYNGLMDEVAIWSRVLTAAQVSEIYIKGLTPTSANLSFILPDDLIHWFRMGDSVNLVTGYPVPDTLKDEVNEQVTCDGVGPSTEHYMYSHTSGIPTYPPIGNSTN